MTPELDTAFMVAGVGRIEDMDADALLATLSKVLKRLAEGNEATQAEAKEIIKGYVVTLTTKSPTEASEADNQRRLWAKQRAMHQALAEAMAIAEVGESGIINPAKIILFEHSINVWNRGADKRIYIDELNGGKHPWKVCLFVTGNASSPPGAIKVESNSNAPDLIIKAAAAGPERAALKAFCQVVAANWNNVNSPSDKALEADLEPWPEHLAAYRKALGVEQATEESANV